MKVLVVDDYSCIRELNIKHLNMMGIVDIDQAGDGLEVLEALGKTTYDLILMDWHMPNMDGYETLKVIRERGIRTPVVFCTDEKKSEMIAAAREAGAADYILKPYCPTHFKFVIAKVLGLKINNLSSDSFHR